MSRGAPMPAIADAVKTRALIQMTWRSFIGAYTAPRSVTSQPPLSRGAAEWSFAEIGRPGLRDLRCGDPDEERGRRRRRRHPHRQSDLLDEPVALAQVAGRAGGDDILPDRVTAPASRHDMVESQPPGGAAVDTAP